MGIYECILVLVRWAEKNNMLSTVEQETVLNTSILLANFNTVSLYANFPTYTVIEKLIAPALVATEYLDMSEAK